MASRRSFVKELSLLGVASLGWDAVLERLDRDINMPSGINWKAVRDLFPITSWDKINFNSGSAGVMPRPVQDHLIELIKYINTKAPYQVWGEWQEIKKENLRRLAALVGSHEQELQVVRNTTEALNMIIYGLSLKSGDEVVIGSHDYPFARNAWHNRARRDGLEIKEVELNIPDSDEEIIAAYSSLLSERTKVVHLTQMTHRQGHIMPVKTLSRLAHTHGSEVVVDGAHVVGQIDVDIKDMDCDYFASSLHKWLNAPLGTGLLFVKKNRIQELHPHLSSYMYAMESMEKYEHLGTRAWANEIGISAALDFHEMIGTSNKSNRLQMLKEYWAGQVSELSNVHLHTWTNADYSAAVATFSIDEIKAGEITKILSKDFDIHAKTVRGHWGDGVRISVNIFTNYKDLDRLIQAITEISRKA